MGGIGRNADKRNGKRKEKRTYARTGFKHSHMGILSCWCAAGAFAILLGCIAWAFASGGEAAGIIGGLAIVSVILAGFGLRWAIRGFREREKNYLTCKIGLPSNAVALISFLAIFIGGLS